VEELAAAIEVLTEGCHDFAETTLINLLRGHDLLTDQEIVALLFSGELSDNCLNRTAQLASQ